MKIFAVIIFSYLTILIILYLVQEHLIFFPDGRDCKEIKTIPFEGETLRFIEKIHPGAKSTLIHFHGNAGGVCDRDFVIKSLQNVPVNIILAEYPGYSGDKSFPNLKKIKENSLLLLRYLQKRGGPIYLYGESLGSAISIYLATIEKVDGLILQSPFSTLGVVGQSAYPFFPVKWLIKDDFKPQKIYSKSLIFIAQDDEIIPKKISEDQSKFFENVKVFTFPNRTHNDLVLDNQNLWREVINFLHPQ